MSTFKVVEFSGGIERGIFTETAKSIHTLAIAMNAQIVLLCPHWAILRSGATGTYKVTW